MKKTISEEKISKISYIKIFLYLAAIVFILYFAVSYFKKSTLSSTNMSTPSPVFATLPDNLSNLNPNVWNTVPAQQIKELTQEQVSTIQISVMPTPQLYTLLTEKLSLLKVEQISDITSSQQDSIMKMLTSDTDRVKFQTALFVASMSYICSKSPGLC